MVSFKFFLLPTSVAMATNFGTKMTTTRPPWKTIEPFLHLPALYPAVRLYTVAMGRIPRSTERISSWQIKWLIGWLISQGGGGAVEDIEEADEDEVARLEAERQTEPDGPSSQSHQRQQNLESTREATLACQQNIGRHRLRTSRKSRTPYAIFFGKCCDFAKMQWRSNRWCRLCSAQGPQPRGP